MFRQQLYADAFFTYIGKNIQYLLVVCHIKKGR